MANGALIATMLSGLGKSGGRSLHISYQGRQEVSLGANFFVPLADLTVLTLYPTGCFDA